MNALAPTIPDIADESLDALAFEIWTYPDLDDYHGLTDHLRRCGWSVVAIGATRLDRLVDEAKAQRETRH